jgi:deoxyribonuclease V
MCDPGHWPTTERELLLVQRQLAVETPAVWAEPTGPFTIGGCFICFERGARPAGRGRERAWAAAALTVAGGVVGRSIVRGHTSHGYEPGLLALREGELLEAAVCGLPRPPDVLLVNATGRDHPRRAGLALHLGAILAVPTVGVTHRPLVAEGTWPHDEHGARSALRIGDEVVGSWLRVQRAVRPLAVDAAWRTGVEVACAVVLAATPHVRTPEPLREARRLARSGRSGGR